MLFSKLKNAKMEEFKQFISVSIATDFDNVAPHILNAERDYLIPVIGQDMFDELQRFYDGQLPGSGSGSGVPEELEELLLLAQSALIHLAYWIGFDLLNVYISDGGFKRTESDTVKGLYKNQERNLKSYFRTNGFNGLDKVLQYLELHLKELPDFSDSPAFTLLKSAFIPTTDIFDKIVFINKSRLTFLRMKPHMQLIEDIEIATILGPVTFEYVKVEMVKETPAQKVTALLPYLRKPIAYLASAMLMEESGADLKENGLYFTQTVVQSDNDTEHKPSDADRITLLVSRNRAFGKAFLDQLSAYLKANATDWPDITPSTGKVLRRDNTDKKTFWA